SYPNSSVNLTAFLIQEYNGPFDHWYFQENEVEILHVLENGTWNTYDLLTNDTFNLSWLVQVDYSSSRGCGGIYHSFLYGLNESQDIVLVVDVPTWEYGYCCLKMDPTIFIIFMGAVMVLASLVTASTGMALMKGERMYINHDNLLDNPTRGKIYRLIQERPGTHFSRIKDILLINPRTLLHHVDILKKFKKIREVNFQNKTLYFDRNLDDKFDFLYFHLNDEKKIKVLKQILLNPGCSFVDLLATLDMPRTTLARHIAALANEGILDIYHEGNQIVSINVHEKFEDFVLESIKRINSPFK
ncbi:MAG: winged helix-turn-helix transcriptional regulator, partial [Candidatus Hodarchaeota archaeon]